MVMTEFECNQLSDSTVMMTYLERDRILLDPPYQREGEVWTLYKKQLLIDSLINGYDIPKLYLHEYEKAKRQDGKLIKYAIVDGKQRLSAIWEFMDGGFVLNDEIQYLRDPKIKLQGLSYEDLRREHPNVHARFTGRTLSIITIRTNDIELIEDMFSRLNEAVPLNAAEKRNAFGGPMPPIIRELVKDDFFADRLSIPSTRYRHHDLACKFLYLEYQGRPSETKKATLDDFVKDFAKRQLKRRAQELRDAVQETLVAMARVFKHRDKLLRSPSSGVVNYLFFRELDAAAKRVTRRDLERFEATLEQNRTVAAQDISKADFELLEYDRLGQSPNDASAIEFRLRIMKKHVLGVQTSTPTTPMPKKS